MTHAPFLFDHADGFVVARAGSRGAWQPLTLVASALCTTAHAHAWGHGHTVGWDAYWAVLALGAIAQMPNPEAYFLCDDACTAERAALLAQRVRTAMRTAGGPISPDERDHPVAFVAAPGVPAAEVPTLAALSVLALEVAADLAGPVPTGAIPIICATSPTDDAGAKPFAGLLATRLDRPDALEIETRHALRTLACALIDHQPGIDDWIPRHRDPTVRLRTPEGAPGIPLVFAPFTVATDAARHAVSHGDLLQRAMARCAPLVFAPVPARAH